MLFLSSPGITLYQAIPYVVPFVSAYIDENTILILCLPVLVLGKIIQLAFRLKNSTPKILKRDSLSNTELDGFLPNIPSEYINMKD